jgi:hypothetical protein
MHQVDIYALKKLVLEVYAKEFGNIREVCRITQIPRSTFYLWTRNDPEFKQALVDANPRELYKDFIEAALVKKIKQGDTASIIFASKTQLKDRGYIERTEHSFVPGDKPVDVELRIDEPLRIENTSQVEELHIEEEQDD